MSNLSGHGRLTGVIRNGGGSGGGSEVIINPSGAAIGIMEKISVDGDVYEVRNVPDPSSASNGDVLTRLASGVGWYPPTKELPVFTSSDNNKVLKINNDTLTWETIPKELPTITTSDEGKVLGISNGVPAWTNVGGGTDTYSTTEHAIGTWIDGSTIYERTFYIASPAFNERSYIDVLLGASRIIEVKGTIDRVVDGLGIIQYSINSYEDDNYNIYVVYDVYADKLAYNLYFAGNSASNLYVTVRYLKVGE